MSDQYLEIIREIQGHIATINDEIGGLESSVAVLESQMSEVLWLQRLVLGAIILAVIGAVLTLILRKKNNK